MGGLPAPAGTPPAIVAKLSADVSRSLADPDVRDKMRSAGIEDASGTPKRFADFIQSEMTRWQMVVEDATIQPE